MITDRIGRHEVLVPINHNYNYNRICDVLGLFLVKTQEIPRFMLAPKKQFKCACAIASTVQLLNYRHDAYCPKKIRWFSLLRHEIVRSK